jgi:two-component system CheB/CheR fusion protein
VEDDPGMREVLKEMLEMSGAVVMAADSAATAWGSFEYFTPELVICDVMLPGENGYSFVRRIRALGPERGGDVPALALTAFAGEGDRQRAVAAGFQEHTAKPVEFDLLVETLSTLRAEGPASHRRPRSVIPVA